MDSSCLQTLQNTAQIRPISSDIGQLPIYYDILLICAPASSGALIIHCHSLSPGDSGGTSGPGGAGGRGLHPGHQRDPLRRPEAPPGPTAGGEGHAGTHSRLVGDHRLQAAIVAADLSDMEASRY